MEDFCVPFKCEPLSASPAKRGSRKQGVKSPARSNSHNNNNNNNRSPSSASAKSPSARKDSPNRAAKTPTTTAKASPKKAAQQLYDSGMEMAALGKAVEASRLLTECVQTLPPVTLTASVARVMIEVKARLVLARISWSLASADDEPSTAYAHLVAAMSLFHSQCLPPPFLPLLMERENSSAVVADWDSFCSSCNEWARACRSEELFTTYCVPVAAEFGARLCFESANWSGAALLYLARDYFQCHRVFVALEFYGHAAECLFLQLPNNADKCLRLCLQHKNPVFLKRFASSMENSNAGFAAIANAVANLDSFALEMLLEDASLDKATAQIARDALGGMWK